MIDQEVCLPILVSMALEVLSQDILIIAEDYEGDLLVRVLRLPQGFWETNVDLKKKLFQILENNHRLINEFKFLKGVWEELKTLLVFFQNL